MYQQINKKDLPLCFSKLESSPNTLYLSHPWDFNRPSIAVVGARKMNPWVIQWLELEFLPVLKRIDLSVISGGARGVDQWAHRMAIRAGQKTLAFLPSGLNKVYPKQLGTLCQFPYFVMATEYDSDIEMRKFHFHARNRLIAASSPLLFVVQAHKKSGSMMTARIALDIGCTVLTLPGHVMDPDFSGNNELLYDGAQLIRDGFDLEVLIRNEFSL